LGFETQHSHASAARIQLRDIQGATISDSITRAGVTADDIETVVARELMTLDRREALHEEPEAAHLGL
jgi:hypothetical protein